jgi:hypothetical protein
LSALKTTSNSSQTEILNKLVKITKAIASMSNESALIMVEEEAKAVEPVPV